MRATSTKHGSIVKGVFETYRSTVIIIKIIKTIKLLFLQKMIKQN